MKAQYKININSGAIGKFKSIDRADLAYMIRMVRRNKKRFGHRFYVTDLGYEWPHTLFLDQRVIVIRNSKVAA